MRKLRKHNHLGTKDEQRKIIAEQRRMIKEITTALHAAHEVMAAQQKMIEEITTAILNTTPQAMVRTSQPPFPYLPAYPHNAVPAPHFFQPQPQPPQPQPQQPYLFHQPQPPQQQPQPQQPYLFQRPISD